MEVKILNLFIICIIDFLFGFFIFKKDPRKEINISYALFVFFVMIWTLAIALFTISGEYKFLLFWNRTFIISAGLIASALLYFTLVFPFELFKLKLYHRILIFLPNVAIAVAAYTPSVLIKDILGQSWGNESILGWGYGWYGLYFVIMNLVGFAILIKKIRISDKQQKVQLYYFLIGLLISISFGATFNLAFILLGNYQFIWLGPYSSFIMIAIAGLAIIKFHLMNIKLVLRRSSVYVISLATIITFTTLINFLFELFFPLYSIWTDFIVLITAVLFFPFIKEKLSNFANKYFFTSLYNSREVIQSINEKLRTTLRIKVINKDVADSLLSIFYCHSVGIFFYNSHSYAFTLKYKDGLSLEEEAQVQININLQKDYLEEGRPILVRLIRDRDYIKYKKFVDLFESLDVEVIVPLMAKGKLIGIIALGSKISGDIYSEEDIGVLRVISDQTAVSIDNSLMYEQVRGFNIKLEKEIDRATKELRKANDELKKLDAAKSEFISIASHQLRTPLTVIKGYISMILEKNFGEISLEVQGALEKVYESNERLVKLVEDLLNISRIESGRLVYKFQTYQIEKIVESVVEELSENAKAKGLELVYHRPETMLPKVEIDSQKMRQVVMNLVDNSIKYTSKAGKEDGKTEVFLELKNNKILFTVSDNGIGISSSDIPNLFQKFSRGKGVSVIHTEGTGLGLYVAKQIILSHNGKIWAESEGEGKGAQMYFELATVPN